MKIAKRILEDIGLPYDGYIDYEIVDHTRWSVIYRYIFEMDGKTFEVLYNKGATELQDYNSWDNEDKIEINEVESKLVPMWIKK